MSQSVIFCTIILLSFLSPTNKKSLRKEKGRYKRWQTVIHLSLCMSLILRFCCECLVQFVLPKSHVFILKIKFKWIWIWIGGSRRFSNLLECIKEALIIRRLINPKTICKGESINNRVDMYAVNKMMELSLIKCAIHRDVG